MIFFILLLLKILIDNFLDQSSVLKHNRALRDLGDLRVMGDDDQRCSLTVELLENVDHDIFIRFVKVSRRLVGKHDFGMIDERPCDTHTLLFAAGKLAWEMLCSVGKSNALQCFERFLFIGHAVVILRYHHVFNGGEVVYQMELLEDQPDFIAADLCQLLTAFLGDIYAVENDLANKGLSFVLP